MSKWNLYHTAVQTIRFILVDYYHPAFDANMDGVLNIIDFSIWVNMYMAASPTFYPFY